ncbi:hypothetical protein Nepgr_032369 [Nepenthes gracilis]|uniref:Uncharacterized protein n=1 Tax=Nepenthes gracilis TaxID=150966 RepID=A0AAD3Y887_NEPGR|nr:hypothetical protein Nepgr_032369 [Nepenthes gracilis]
MKPLASCGPQAPSLPKLPFPDGKSDGRCLLQLTASEGLETGKGLKHFQNPFFCGLLVCTTKDWVVKIFSTPFNLMSVLVETKVRQIYTYKNAQRLMPSWD